MYEKKLTLFTKIISKKYKSSYIEPRKKNESPP